MTFFWCIVCAVVSTSSSVLCIFRSKWPVCCDDILMGHKNISVNVCKIWMGQRVWRFLQKEEYLLKILAKIEVLTSSSSQRFAQRCESRATWCLRGEDLRSNNDVIFFAAKKMTSSLLHNHCANLVQVTPLWIKIRLKGMSDIDIEANVTTIFFRVLQRSRAHQMGWIRWSNWEQNESGSYSGEHITRSHQSPRFAHCIAKANTLINALQMFLGKLGTAKYF